MNEKAFAILADSCNDIPQGLVEQHHIYTMPLLINYKSETYKDGVDISPQQVYDRMPGEIPSTSLPLGSDIDAMFDQIKADGHTHILVSAISSGLSGTYQAVRLAAEAREDLTITVVDTLNIGIGSGFIALYAAQLRAEGLSFEETAQKVAASVRNSKVLFGLSTLEYLIKGGRIGKVQGILGSALNIKPIISCNEEGIYDTVAKVRGRKQNINKMIEMVKEQLAGKTDYYLGLCHGAAEDEMNYMKEQLRDIIAKARVYTEGQISPVLGVHTGPGLLGVGYMILED